jgi:hypothetical protein
MVRVTVVSNDAEVKRPSAWGNRLAMRRRPHALAAVLLVLLEGYAGLGCTPTTVVFARKDERTQFRSEPRGLRTDEPGGVSEPAGSRAAKKNAFPERPPP